MYSIIITNVDRFHNVQWLVTLMLPYIYNDVLCVYLTYLTTPCACTCVKVIRGVKRSTKRSLLRSNSR